jgi:type IV pilus assembly protein PilA
MQREHRDARAVDRSDAGFTLIELMMVILIIAILIAVLIPTFVGASTRANDRATQASLRNALTAAKTVYVDKQDYTLATPAALTAEGMQITFVDAATAPSGQNSVSVDPVTADYVVFGGISKSGTCFYAADDAAGTGSVFARWPASGGCMASGAPLPGDAAWQAAW